MKLESTQARYCDVGRWAVACPLVVFSCHGSRQLPTSSVPGALVGRQVYDHSNLPLFKVFRFRVVQGVGRILAHVALKPTRCLTVTGRGEVALCYYRGLNNCRYCFLLAPRYKFLRKVGLLGHRHVLGVPPRTWDLNQRS